MVGTEAPDPEHDTIPDPRRDGAPNERYLSTDHLQSDLGRRSIRGGTVTIAAQGIKVVFQFAAVVVLARLLEPVDFGRFAMVGTVLAMLELFKDLGLSTATVQRPDISHRQISTLFWLNTGLGCCAALLTAALAPVLAWLYGEPVLLEITPAVALAFVFTGLSVQHLALLRRQMQFGTVATVQICAEVIAISTSIALAIMGFGLWVLVLQRIVWAVVLAVGAWLACRWQPGLPGRYADVRDFVSFGANATGAMTVGHVAANLDKVLIGWYWGASTLGFYDRAQRIAQLPIQNLNAPLATVALAALSRLTDQPARYRTAFITAVERLGLVMVPIAVVLITVSDLAVVLVLGPQWADAAPILAWMGVALLYMPVTYSLSWLYLSQDRTPEMLRAGMLNAALTLAALFAGLPFGASGVAASYALSGAIVRGPILFWLVGRQGPIGLEDLLRLLILPSCAAAAAVGVIFALRAWPPVMHLSQVAGFAGAIAVSGLVTLAVYAVAPRGRRILIDAARLPIVLFGRKASA